MRKWETEPFIRDRAIPNTVGFFSVPKTLGKDDPDSTKEEIEKCKRYAIRMEDEECTSQIIETLERYKSEPQWMKMNSTSRMFEYELKIFCPYWIRFRLLEFFEYSS